MSFRAGASLLLGLGIAVGGCRAVDVHPDDRAPTQVIQTRWQVTLNAPPLLAYFPKETASPAYGRRGRVVVAGSDAGELVAADARSGRVLWRFQTPGKIRGAPTIVGRRVYVGSTDGSLHAVDLAAGTETWEAAYKTDGAITSPPAVGGGLVVFQNNDNRTYAVDAKTGEYRWDQGRPRPDFFTIKGEGGPTIAGSVVYAGYEDGHLSAMRLEDGASLWSKNLAADETQFIDVDTRPVVNGDVVYAGCFNVGLYALGRTHGDVKWLHRARGALTPALGDRYLFVTDGSRRITALDPATGQKQWRTRVGYGELAPPVVKGERLFVSTGDGLLWLDVESGAALARISPDNGQSGPPVSSGSWLHFVTNSGALVGARLL